MAHYIAQPNEGMPHDRAFLIHHFVKTFSSPDPVSLDSQVNAFLTSLETIQEVPIIKDIKYDTVYKTHNPDRTIWYSSQVHYLLVD